MTNVALLGFGTVGSGVAQILTDNRELIKNRTGLDINVKYILDLRDFPGNPMESKIVHDYQVILNDPEVSIVAEMMGGLHPAYDFSIAAIRAGKNVVTSNKAVVAEFGPELLAEAQKKGVRYLFEASVGGGIPIIRPLTGLADSNDIYEIDGILNGTTNYILTEMKNNGTSFEEALKQAQKLGYAEADPTADIEGYDTCRKICILAAVAFGEIVPFEKVRTVGIKNISKEAILAAEASGASVKLIARALRTDRGLYLAVEPMAVRRSSPLCSIDDVYNGILVRGKISGDLMFFGKGAGRLPTGGAVVSDIIDIADRGNDQPRQQVWTISKSEPISILTDDEIASTVAELGTPVSF